MYDAEMPISLFADEDYRPPAGHMERFGSRWRLVGAGLSNVWKYGDLVLAVPSGRLLLRGPNGTGKTTALEALWPFLLDLNPLRLIAGKSRTTTLSSLMREGASGKRRFGYVWLTFEGPNEEGTHTFGTRLQYSEGSSPMVRMYPFTVPGRPIDDVPLHGPRREPLMIDQFGELITACGGQMFDDEEAYVAHLAARVWSTSPNELRDIAERIRTVRNPTLLGDVSPRAAAEALREALPAVDVDIVSATADALAESNETRKAFDRDSRAADILAEFADIWAGHVVSVVGYRHSAAVEAEAAVRAAIADENQLAEDLTAATSDEQEALAAQQSWTTEVEKVDATLRALERSAAFEAAGALAALDEKLTAQRSTAELARQRWINKVDSVRRDTSSLNEQLGNWRTSWSFR